MWDLIVSVPDHCLSFYFPKPVEVLDGVLYLTLLNRTFEQIHEQWLRNLTLTELKTDKDVGGQYGLCPSWYAIELSIILVLWGILLLDI